MGTLRGLKYGIPVAIVLWAMIFVVVAFAQPMISDKGTPDLKGIKEVSAPQAPSQVKVYEIPMTAIMQKADGSGDVEVVVPSIKVTKAQLQNGIAQANKQIEIQTAQVAKLQQQLTAIIEKEKTQ